MALVLHEDDHHEPEFIDQQLITNPEPCTFLDFDIEKLKGFFPPNTVFRPYDPSAQADFSSKKWVCFPEYPFTIGLKYPFPPLFNEFFSTTGICYSQTMPMVWRVLSVLQSVIDFYDSKLGIPEIAQSYNLRTHGNHYFLLQSKSKRFPLVARATQNDHKWKSRFFFVARDSLPNGDSISSVWVEKAPIFTDLAPPTQDTEANLRAFLEIPEDYRTFKHPHPVESAESQQSEASMSSKLFSLEEIDTETPAKTAPKSSKPRIPNLRSNSAKKRKAEEAIDLSDPVAEASKAFESLVKSYHEKEEMIDDLKKIGLARAADHDKDLAELAKIKKELKETKSLLSKSLAETDIRVEEAKNNLVLEAKRDAAIAIFEARIKMANDAAARGVDISFWDMESWKTKLAKFKGQGPDVASNSEDPASKAPKASKGKSSKATKSANDKAPIASGRDQVVNEDVNEMSNFSSVKEVLDGLAAAGDMIEGVSKLGEDGK